MISECFWTAAAKHADIVLPATTSFERNDLTMTGDYSNQHLVPMKQVVPPRYEARNDFDVFAELSERGRRAAMRGLRKEKVSCNGWKRFITLPGSAGQASRLNCRHLLSSGKPTS